MKAQALGLQVSVVSVYDQTKTTVVGRAAQKTINSKSAVGTPLVSFADTTTDAAITPLHFEVTSLGNAFIFNAPTAGVGTIAHYTFNLTTGAWAYVGKLAYTLPNSPATTHTLRSVRVDDTGGVNFKIFVNTVGTVTANGGLFMLGHGSAPVTAADFVPTGFATLAVATAANQKAVYWLQETGGTNLLTASQGMAISITGTKIYVGNNVAATFQVYVFDYSNAITTVGAGGVTSDLYSHKTGTLPGIGVTILLLNNFNIGTPTADSGVSVALQGFECLFIGASTAINIGRTSELTSGAVTWPSFQTSNIADAPSSNVTPTATTAHFSNTLQRFIYQFSVGRWLVKQFPSNGWQFTFGSCSNSQLRTAVPITFQEFGAVTVASTFTREGWIFQSSSTVGQIGVLAFDLQSSWNYDTSYVISKVITIQNPSTIHTLRFSSPVRSFAQIYYRTSGFGSPTGGWVLAPQDGDWSAINFNGVTQIQFKLMPRFERDGSVIPLQFYEGFLDYTPPSEISDNWVGSVDNTTDSTQTPAHSAFRLVTAYGTSVPTMYFRAYDDSGVLVASANTSANAASFEYSNNNGTSWNALGTIPNTALTTELRYNWSSPPGVKVTVSLRES